MGRNYTLYIGTENDKKFAAEANKGGLINSLLDAHYKKRVTQLPGQATIEEAAPPTVDDTKLSLEQPCCSKASRCKHWDWDGDGGVWKNTLSGRTVDA